MDYFVIRNVKEYQEPIYFEKIILNKKDDIVFIGDIHSSIHSLWKIIRRLDEKKGFFLDFMNLKLKPCKYIVFLGDFLDRGPYSIETLLIILKLKKENVNNVHIINGNHENLVTNSRFGFLEELQSESLQHLFLFINTFLNKSL